MADSKHNYIITKRVTNPLQPTYVGLDGYPYDQSPPCTPAYDINNPPRVVKEKMEEKLAKRSEADEMQRTKLLNASVNEGRLNPNEQIVARATFCKRLVLHRSSGGTPSRTQSIY